MSYNGQSALSQDLFFINRVTACVATQPELTIHPSVWANDKIWLVAAEPGLADAYSYALETGVDNPGANETVITDAQILSAVQHILLM